MAVGLDILDSYAAARHTFCYTALKHGAEVRPYRFHGATQNGEVLATDVAWFGPRDAKYVMVTQSGLHGVEGYFGSALQVEWMKAAQQIAGVATLHIHALCPDGMADMARVGRDGVDANRNGLDFTKPLPDNVEFDRIKQHLPPAHFAGIKGFVEHLQLVDTVFRVEGFKNFKRALMRGQYHEPGKMYYGGDAQGHAARTLQAIRNEFLPNARTILVIDLHSGLGDFGNLDFFLGTKAAQDPQVAILARTIWGDKAGMPTADTDYADINGDTLDQWYTNSHATWLRRGHATVVPMAAEFGTYSNYLVLRAMLARATLAAGTDPLLNQPARAAQVKRTMFDRFNPPKAEWRQTVREKADDIFYTGQNWLAHMVAKYG